MGRAAARVERPGAGVVGRHLGPRLRLGCLEQRRAARIAGDPRVVVEPDQRLDEAVEHPQVGGERVDRVVAAVVGRHAHALRRRGLEDGQRPLGDRQHVGLALQAGGAAGQRLHGGALGEAGDPRRPAAAEAEVVLPRQAARALGGEQQQLVEHDGQAVVLAAAPEPVELAEVAQHLELQARAGVVLPDQLGALELDPAPGCQQRPRAPPLEVALHGQPQRVQAAGRELAAGRDALDLGEHLAHDRLAHAGEPAGAALDVLVHRAPQGVVLGRDLRGVAQPLELADDRALLLLFPGHAGHGVPRCTARRSHLRGLDELVVLGPHAAVLAQHQHAVGRRGGGAQKGGEQA